MKHNQFMRLNSFVGLTFLLLSFVCQTVFAAKEDEAKLPESRSFYMGLGALPYGWPYAVSPDALEETIDIAQEHADLIGHHFDYGIPWPEALAGESYHPEVEKELNERAKGRKPGQKVYVGIGAQHSDRNKLANYWAGRAGEEKPLPKEWQNKTFDDPDVIKAYLNFARDVIERLKPDYYAYSLECTDTFKSENDSDFKKFLAFAREVYQTLKKEYPELLLTCTFQTNILDPSEPVERKLRLAKALLPYVDLIAVSIYPYVGYYNKGKEANPRHLPSNWLSRWSELDPSKPFAISETAYISEDLVINSFHWNFKGKEQWQADYVQKLFEELNRLDAEFVHWFHPKDYDESWKIMQEAGLPDFLKLWKDAGLFDGESNPRPKQALKVWDKWLELPREKHGRPSERTVPPPEVSSETDETVARKSADLPAISLDSFLGVGGTVDVKHKESSIEWTYKFNATDFSILFLSEPNFQDWKGLEIRLRSEKETSMAFILQEKGEVRYDHRVSLAAGQWRTFSLSWNDFKVQDETPDPNGRLDLDNLESFSLFDMGGLAGKKGKNTITIEFLKPRGKPRGHSP